jgi:tetratricopeptide (TPR) repeat protein
VHKALENYREQLRIARRLAAAESGDAQAQRTLAVAFNKIGDALLQQGETQKALESHRDSLKVFQRLAAADPKDAQAQHELAVAFGRVGDVLAKQGDVPKALENHRENLKIARRLAAANPRDAEVQANLVVALNRIGDILLEQGDTRQALENYRESFGITERRAARDPRNFEAQMDLAVGHYKIGQAEKQTFRYAEAASLFKKALEVLGPWQQAGKLKGSPFADWPDILQGELAFCRDAPKALGKLDALLNLPTEQAVPLLALRAQLLAQQAKHTEAVTAADKLAGLVKTGAQRFAAATAFAWCSRDKANAERHAARTLALLGQARDDGFFKDKNNVEQLKTNEAFKPLRDRADFKKLLASLTSDNR